MGENYRKDENPIFLVGFMGSGKTTVGQELAHKIGYSFIDLDSEIEREAGMPIFQIFAEKGETVFREMERNAIRSCSGIEKAVIALGGGAYVSEINREIIQKIGLSVWLDCPIDICYSRIAGDPLRPLLKTKSEMAELLNKRTPSYKMADISVNAEGEPVAVAANILDLITSMNISHTLSR